MLPILAMFNVIMLTAANFSLGDNVLHALRLFITFLYYTTYTVYIYIYEHRKVTYGLTVTLITPGVTF